MSVACARVVCHTQQQHGAQMVRIWLGGMMANEWTKQHTLTAALVRCSHQLPFFQVRTRSEAHKSLYFAK